MNTKVSKGIIGITLAMIMIASIFAAIAPSTTADGVDIQGALTLSKIAEYDQYYIGETVTYDLLVGNPNQDSGCTIDIFDQYAYDAEVEIASDVYLAPSGDSGDTWADTISFEIVAGDVTPGGWVINTLRVAGNETEDPYTPVDGAIGESVVILSNPPVFDFDFDRACCLNMSFVGTATDDDTVVNYSWDFGSDAVLNSGGGSRYYSDTGDDPDSPWCVFGSCGYKTVKLSGYDNDGNYGYYEDNVYVPCDPTAVATANPMVVDAGAGESVTFSGTSSHADPLSGSSIESYLWEFDDGYPDQTTVTVTRVVDGDPEDIICGTLTVSDGHCTDNATVCVSVREVSDCRLRLYGRLNEGAGDPTANYAGEPNPENPPYTDAMAPFYPQASESPRKDFLTFDPIMMYHDDNDWDNDGVDDWVYPNSIRNDGDDVSEKIFKRMWYEPTEWYKDEGFGGNSPNGELDLLLQDGSTITATEAAQCDSYDIWDKIVPFNVDDTKADIYAPSIKQEFTFMLLDSSVCPEPLAAPTGTSSMLIPMATWESDNGIDSFDIDGNGAPDKVLIESEYSLCMNIDNDDAGVTNPLCSPDTGYLEQLDTNGDDLSGDETLVLTSDWMTMELGDELQFFDHKIVLWDVFGELPVGPEAHFLVYYQGDTSPDGQLRSWPSIAGDEVKFFSQGFENTKAPGQLGVQGPFFVLVNVVDGAEDKVTVKVGRMFGETYANIGTNPYWNQKQFYVDKVCYNVVAIKADDNESLKYVTIRQKLPKVPIKIPNHTQHLKGWLIGETLPELPQYNMPHTIVQDVRREWTVPTEICDKIGEYLEVPPLVIEYDDETIEPRFRGELKEILLENGYNADSIGAEVMKESWMIEWIQTLPREYTLFRLPPEDEGGIYMLTSAFYADEAVGALWDGGAEEEPFEILDGQRLKFWYEDCSGPYFVDFDGTLRIYGRLARGAGDPSVLDPRSDLHPENPPYTNPMAPFWPQAEEAPDKDFVTFNPIMMYHNDNDWDNDGVKDNVYANSIRRNFDDASEKIFKRMWYEPTEWYKDEGYTDEHNGELDLVLRNPDGSLYDIVPASDLEDADFVVRLIANGITVQPWNTPDSIMEEDYPYELAADIYAPSIKQEFTFMLLDSSVCPEPAAGRTSGGTSMLIPMATWVSDNGIDSFDANGDGQPDRVIIDSEAAMIRRWLVDNDFGDNDGQTEDLDPNGMPMSGDETLILRLDEMTLSLPSSEPDYGDTLQFFDHKLVLTDVFGDKAKFQIFYQGDTSPEGNPRGYAEFSQGDVKYFEQGLENTKVPPFAPGPQGPFFVIVTNVDKEENKVSLIVGRFFGETRANIGTNNWWNQKQFYVDGVCYNVVAIMTEGERGFKYVTFRQKLPKVPVKIPNHTQHLKAWTAGAILPEMPQYNMNHTVLLDIQKGWTTPSTICDKLGDPMNAPALEISYVRETTEPRFHGELKEIYYEYGTNETWMIEWFQTIPYEYTGFDLPEGHGLYLVTSAFGAPEACAYYHDLGDELDYPGTARLKFWFDPADPTDLYVTRPPTVTPLTIDEYYDRAANGGDADGVVDIAEINKAFRDYVFAFGTGRYPFGEEGIYTAADLAWMIGQY